MCRDSLRSIRSVALCLLGTLWLVTACARPESDARTDERTVRDFSVQFLRAFENLDMPSFIACFADDAMVFFPTPYPPLRIEGKAAIQAQFQEVFAAIRADTASGPPYHTLQPENLVVQVLGADAAVVSFHLRNETRVARRSLVLRKAGADWRIVHLHASNVAIGQ